MLIDSPPKWKLLTDVLTEIKEECKKSNTYNNNNNNNNNNNSIGGDNNIKNEDNGAYHHHHSSSSSSHQTILLIVADHFTLKQVQDVINMGVEQVIDQRYRWFISQQAMNIKNRLGERDNAATKNYNYNKAYKQSSSSSISSSSSSSSNHVASHHPSMDIDPTIEQMMPLKDTPVINTTTTAAIAVNTGMNIAPDITHLPPNHHHHHHPLASMEAEHLGFDITSKSFLTLDEEKKLILIQVTQVTDMNAMMYDVHHPLTADV
jgi:hypothetical protein